MSPPLPEFQRRCAVSGAGSGQLQNRAGADPALADVLRCLLYPQPPLPAKKTPLHPDQFNHQGALWTRPMRGNGEAV